MIIECLSRDRREEVDGGTPDGLRQTIVRAMDELRGHSALQNFGYVQAIAPVQALLLEVAEAAAALSAMREPIPTLDFMGIDQSFLCGMPSHPVLDRIAMMIDQQRLKTELLAKWGPRRQRVPSSRLLTFVQ